MVFFSIIVIIFSDSCDGKNENDCLTCNILNTFRLDYHLENHTCPCKDGYYHNNTEICV